MQQPHKLNHCQQCDQQPVKVNKAGNRTLCGDCVTDFAQASANTLYHPDDMRLLGDYSKPRSKRIITVQVKTDAKKMLCELPFHWGRGEQK